MYTSIVVICRKCNQRTFHLKSYVCSYGTRIHLTHVFNVYESEWSQTIETTDNRQPDQSILEHVNYFVVIDVVVSVVFVFLLCFENGQNFRLVKIWVTLWMLFKLLLLLLLLLFAFIFIVPYKRTFGGQGVACYEWFNMFSLNTTFEIVVSVYYVWNACRHVILKIDCNWSNIFEVKIVGLSSDDKTKFGLITILLSVTYVHT